MKQYITPTLVGVLSVLVVTFAFTTPQPAEAQSYQQFQQQYQFQGFTPRTDRERLAFLYGVLSQLQRQVESYEQIMLRDRDTNQVRVIRGVGSDDDGEYYLEGTIDMGNRNNGLVFFAYGQDRDLVDDVEDEDEFRDIDEAGEDLQLVIVDRDLDGEEDYRERVTGLEEDERYYYRICVEYEDRDDDPAIVCGNTKWFTADGDFRDEAPDVETFSARNISDDEAELRGEVDMNDFRDGYVFFVYGEDEDDVEDVEDEDEYDDIDERGDDLQKFRVDSYLDGREEYEEFVFGLDSNTDHYFRLCVEYEDEDDDLTLECGNVEEFETDNY